MPISGPGLGGQDQSKTKDAQRPPERGCETSEKSHREGDCIYLACTVGNERLTASPSSAGSSPSHTSFSSISSCVHPSKGSSPSPSRPKPGLEIGSQDEPHQLQTRWADHWGFSQDVGNSLNGIILLLILTISLHTT